MEIIKLEDKNNRIFDKICDWYYNYWGIKNNEIMEEVKCTFSYSLNKEKLRAFHDDLLQEYIEYNSGVSPVLFKMKEIWAYMGNTFPGGEKHLKKLRKTDKLEVYEEMVNELFTLLS